MSQRVTVKEAIQTIQSGHSVFVQGAAATPTLLLNELIRQSSRLKNVELMHLHTFGDAAYADIQYSENFRVTNLFVGGNMRKKMSLPRVDYLPCFLSEIPALFRKGIKKIDVALIQVSPPDAHGNVSLGTSVDVTLAAVQNAKVVVAVVNSKMPRVFGDGILRLQDIDYWIEDDSPIWACPSEKPSAIELEIGKKVAELVEDGSTLQMGIGAIPDAVLSCLKNHRNLGIHTEMWTDGALPLIQSGVVTNSLKKVHPGKTVSTFLMGSQSVYDFIHDNPSVIQLDAAYVNDVRTIARNPKVVAINSAVEVDLTGQVCADSIGSRIISGVGGQMDFIRGASLSEGGRAIIAMPSRTKSGKSRLVAQLSPGAGVVTTRAHVHFVVTEYGMVDLYGKTLSERAKGLIQIAHPDDREMLEKAVMA